MFQRSGRSVASRLECHSCPFCPKPFPGLLRNGGAIPFAIPQAQYFSAETLNPGRRERRKHESSRRGHRWRKLVFPSIKPLGVNTLGKPSNVIVAPPRPKKRSPRRRDSLTAAKEPGVAEEEDEAGGVLWKTMHEMREEISRGQKMLDAKDVIANFGRLRSKYDTEGKQMASGKEWEKLRSTLVGGFTYNQLLGYMAYLQQFPETAPDKDGEAIVQHSGWKSGKSLFLEMPPTDQKRTANSVSGFRNMRGKTILAEIILRQYWGLSIRGEIGRLDISFEPLVLSALLHSNNKPLKALEETYEHEVDIKAWEVGDMATITGTEEHCLEVQKEIEELKSGVRSMEIDLPNDGGSVFGAGDEQLEAEFTDLLKTHFDVFCDRDESSRKLSLYSTGDADVDNALRSIQLSMVMPLDRATGLFTYSAETQTANLYPFISPDSLPWPDRKVEWTRWAKPFSSIGISDGRSARRPPSAVYLNQPDAALPGISELLFQHNLGSVASSEDQSHLRETVTASLGKTLFKRWPSYKTGDGVQFSDLKNPESRTFVTDIPTSSSFLQGLDRVRSDGDSDTCRIRLLPSPKNEGIFPPIDLELNLSPVNQFSDPNVTPTISRASAIVDESNVDLLLPDTSLDVRFTKTVHYDLFEGLSPLETGNVLRPTQDYDSPVVGKLRKFVANLPASYPLTGPQAPPPAFCTLLVPRKFIRPTQGSSSVPWKEQALAFTEGEYIIPPLESIAASRMTRLHYKDFELNYTNPLTGPVLPQRTTQLTLSLGRYDDEPRPFNALPNRRLSSLLEDDDGSEGSSLASAFRPLFSRSCQLAFELGASYLHPSPSESSRWSDEVLEPLD